MPGYPVKISSCPFEKRVPRSHLVNGIPDLLPKPALSGCCWLHCSVVKLLNTLPPLQKKIWGWRILLGVKEHLEQEANFNFISEKCWRCFWVLISSGRTFLMPNFTPAHCKCLVNPTLLLDLCSSHLSGGTSYCKTIHTDHLCLQFPQGSAGR